MIYMINPQTHRFCWLSIQQDLFGQPCVVKVFGNINKKNIREIWQPCESEVIASQIMFEIEQITRKRGYIYANTSTADDFILTPQII